MPRPVFVYGTLLVERVQRRVTGRAFAARPAVVRGYARRLVRGEAYPSLVPAPGEQTAGAVLEGVDAEALARLDRYEGPLYERVLASATLADGAELDVWLWLVRAAERHRVGTEPWDLATFVARDLARFEAEYEGLGGT